MAEPALKERPAPALPRADPVPMAGYDDDFHAWLFEQAALLRAGRLDALDTENLAEELEDLGQSQQSKLWSLLRVLVMHMLKWDQQPEKRTRSWMHSIREQRRRYHKLLKKNPSLIAKRDEARDDSYPTARDWAAGETHLPEDEFPDTCPYTWDDILTRPFEAEPAPE